MVCLKSGAGRYRKPVEGAQQRDDVGEHGEIGNKLCRCVMDQIMLDNVQ